MMLVYVRAVFRQAVRETHEPRAIVARIASAVHEETRGESYLTCIVVRVDDEGRRLTTRSPDTPGAHLRHRPATCDDRRPARGTVPGRPVRGGERRSRRG
jgi:hypothetical protein